MLSVCLLGLCTTAEDCNTLCSPFLHICASRFFSCCSLGYCNIAGIMPTSTASFCCRRNLQVPNRQYVNNNNCLTRKRWWRKDDRRKRVTTMDRSRTLPRHTSINIMAITLVAAICKKRNRRTKKKKEPHQRQDKTTKGCYIKFRG